MMSNPVSTYDHIVSTCNAPRFYKHSVYNNKQLPHAEYSTTSLKKTKPLRYSTYSHTQKILTSDPLSSRQIKSTLSQRKLKISDQSFKHLNAHDGLQYTSNDYPEGVNNTFEAMHLYFSDTAPVTAQKRLANSTCDPLPPSKIAKITKETEVLPVKNEQLTAPTIFESSLDTTEPGDILHSSTKKYESIEEFWADFEEYLKSQSIEDSFAQPECTKQPKSDLSCYQNTQNTSHSETQSDYPINQHQLNSSQSTSLIRIKKKRILQFILNKLISDLDNSVNWVDSKQGIFEFTDPKTFSEHWSNHRKSEKTISFKNITRAIRLYYKEDIMTKFSIHGIPLPKNQYRLNLSHPRITAYFQIHAIRP